MHGQQNVKTLFFDLLTATLIEPSLHMQAASTMPQSSIFLHTSMFTAYNEQDATFHNLSDRYCYLLLAWPV